MFSALGILMLILFLSNISTGSSGFRIPDLISPLFNGSTEINDTILMKFRLPKALTAILVGFALSVSGLQMQTIFRNPMAGPYVLGVSSGASLGVAVIVLGFSGKLIPGTMPVTGSWAITIAACAGAAMVLIIMFLVSLRVSDIMTLLIIGIMLASSISALVSVMQYFSNETLLKSYVIWTMGSLGNLSTAQLKIMAITVSAGLILSILTAKMLNALLIGEVYASTLGLNIMASRILIFTCTSILAGGVTAFCGPIGFIGIAVPHIARNLFRTADHRILLPATALAGACLMLLSDTISNLPGNGNVLPINSVTSLIGIPLVIWIVMKNRKLSGTF